MATPGLVAPVDTTPVIPPVNPQVTGAANASMAEGVNVQVLVAAFAFGIVVNAASAAAFLVIRGRTASLLKDGQRLVLAIFLISVALWAQVDFVATAINPSAAAQCQVAIAFASAFDQLARVALLQYFLWASAGVATTAVKRLVPQGLLVARLALGGVLVGVQRPQFNPVCVPTTELLPVAIAAIITDAVLFLICLVRVFSAGGLRHAKEDTADHVKAKGVSFTMAGFALWTGASIPMHLGITAIAVILRTALPAAAVTILVGIIAAFSSTLPVNDSRPLSFGPEAPSPRRLDTTRDLQNRDLQNRGLQSRRSSNAEPEYPPSRYEDLKRDEFLSISAFPKPPTRDGAGEFPNDGTLPGIVAAPPGQAIGVGGLPVQGQLFPPMRAETAPAPSQLKLRPSEARADLVRPKRGLFGMGGAARGTSAAGIAISGPILRTGADAQAPFDKISTVDLATAARNDRERREQTGRERLQSTTLVASRPAPRPPSSATQEAMRRSQSAKRKEVESTVAPPEATLVANYSGQQTLGEPVATTTSAELSPGVEELRKRSPRLSPQDTPQTPRPLGDLENPRRAPQPGQKQSTPRRPPRPESLDIDVDPQPTEPAPRQDVPTPRPSAPAVTPVQQEVPSMIRPVQPQPLGAVPASRMPSPPQETSSPRVPPSRQMASPPQTPPTPKAAAPPQATRQGQSPMAMYNNPIAPPSPPEEPQQKPVLGKSALSRIGSVRTDIRPSRQRPPSVEKGIPSPEKPPVQRRVATGLPGNPRAMATRQLEMEAKSQRQQTVMFMNNIEYSDPVGVRNILDGAAKKAAANTQAAPPVSRTSVLHRPRPIPRYWQGGEEKAAEPLGNKGSSQARKSSVSASTKKSILKSTSGSPTRLPPLPPPPKRPDNNIRALPNADNNVRPLPNNTKSMTLDEKMDIFFPAPTSGAGSSNGNAEFQMSSVPAVPALPPSFLDMDDESGKHKPDRTTKTSFQTQSVVEIVDMRNRPPLNALNTAKFSSDTETETTVSQAWLPSLDSMQGPDYPGYEGTKRRSSAVLPYPTDGMPMFIDAKVQERDEAANRASAPATKQGNHADSKTTYAPESNEEEIMTIMFENSGAQRQDQAERELWMANSEPAVAQSAEASGESGGKSHWHQRIGKECPTFTNRKEMKSRVRNVVPPTPLLLRGAASKNMVIIRAAEPSPLESPTEAYGDIQAKLEQLDQRGRDSSGSGERKQDLLANLEAEMGVQEEHWQEMQDGLRDSLSSVKTSSRRTSADESASEMPGQGRGKGGGLLKPSAVTHVQVYTPTPPGTDESEDDGIAARVAFSQARTMAKPSPPKVSLWQPIVVAPAPATSVNRLWAPTQKPLPRAALTLTSADMTPLPRKTQTTRSLSQPADKVQSSALWQKSRRPATSSGRLWGATAPPRLKGANRPLTQRPARKSRRMTALPDIVENPQPLPDRRGTLGIFQFPWGEQSDTATLNLRSTRMFMAMPGTMTTGGPASTTAALLEARSRQIEAEEYSSSFFDDYEDEAPGDDDSDLDVDGSDEDFDEATLWEIASLLKADNMSSLLPSYFEDDDSEPRGEGSVVDDDDDYVQGDGGDEQKGAIIMALDTAPLPVRRQPLLWAKPSRPRSACLGLPQPDARAWLQYMPPGETRVQARSRREEPASIESRALWEPQQPVARQESLLWGPAKQRVVKLDTAPHPVQHSLWVKPSKPRSAGLGLPQPDSRAWMQYMPLGETSAQAKSRLEEPASIESSSLWKPQQPPAHQQSLLWGPTKQRAAEPDTAPLPIRRQPSLWIKPSRTRSAGLGLPQPDARAWMQYMPFPGETRAQVKSRREEPASIESSTLWKPQQPLARQQSLLMWVAPVWMQSDDDAPGLFNPHNKRRDFRTTAKEPAALHLTRGANRPRVDTETLQAPSSSALWSPEDSRPQGNNWLAATSRPPVRGRRHGRPAASTEDWDAALREAIEASSLRKRRVPATEAEWTAALNDALGPATTTPPAPGLWSKPQGAEPPGLTSALWQPGQTRQHAPAWIVPEGGPATTTRRRPRTPESERPPSVFLWQNMWRVQDVVEEPRTDWLEAVANKRFTGIQFRY